MIDSYKAAIEQSHREAVATVVAALLVTAFFWGSIALFEESLLGWFGLPLWFWLSCIGGYAFSILVVIVLVARYFKNFRFDYDRHSGSQS